MLFWACPFIFGVSGLLLLSMVGLWPLSSVLESLECRTE